MCVTMFPDALSVVEGIFSTILPSIPEKEKVRWAHQQGTMHHLGGMD